MADDYYALFEKIGEKTVREHLAHGRFNSRKTTAAQLWIQDFERKRSESSSAEQLSIARDARDAAWAAARAARTANTMAKIALTIAAISTIITVIGVVLK